ncbi:MAG: hypothetical protein KDD89_05475 [Anaerolineales bacterium]|nr:hypothetical protein [Anaerolineales bacterium]
MAFEWLNNFHQEMEKPENYAEKTLAAYRLGLRAKGSIVGVRVVVDEKNCCTAARESLDTQAIYTPDDAPHLPLAECALGRKCTCVYRPVMKYEVQKDAEEAQDSDA